LLWKSFEGRVSGFLAVKLLTEPGSNFQQLHVSSEDISVVESSLSEEEMEE